MIIDIVKIFIPSTIAFVIGIAITPALTDYLYKYQMWKKRAGKKTFDGKETEIFNKLHETKEVGTPKFGGVIIWLSAFLAAIITWSLSHTLDGDILSKLDFISRNQTWIPLATLLLGAFIGGIDDYLEVKGNGGHIAG